MRPDQKLISVKEQLKAEVHPDGVDLCLSVFNTAVNCFQYRGLHLNINSLKEFLPTALFYAFGHLTDVLLKQKKIDSYKKFALVMDTMVQHELFYYQEGDDIEDLNVDEDLLSDIECVKVFYPEHFSIIAKKSSAIYHADSSRT